MGSPQSTTKRGFDVNQVYNQNDETSSMKEEGEDGAQDESKRFKQELHPLQMGSVIEKIFAFLDVESIKNCRQVNSLWSIEGAKILITKCYVKIPSDLQFYSLSSKSKDIDEFKAFLSHKSSDHSMISNISIGKVKDIELWKSLGILGPQVQSLKLNNYNDEATLAQLLDLLPNLNYLNLNSMDKGLLSVYRPFIINLLTAVMSNPEKSGNPLVISFMLVEPRNVEQLEDVKKFAECNNIMIEKLKFEAKACLFKDVPNFELRIANIISKLLSTSQNVLKDLILEDCELYLSILDFPCMTALVHLCLYFAGRTFSLQHYKFSPSFKFSEKVPNLQDISINDKMYYAWVWFGEASSDGEFFNNLLENTGTASFVKEVNIWGGYSDLSVDPLFKTFPNIQELVMSVDLCSGKLFRSLWTLGENLRKLTLLFNFKVIGRLNSNDLDSILTGFTKDTVEKIKKAPNLDPFAPEELEELRVNPSILNLKHLEQLSFRLDGNSKGWPERMLAVASKYAFSFLPNNPRINIWINDCGPGLEYAKKTFEYVSNHPNIVLEFEEDFLCCASTGNNMESDTDSYFFVDMDSESD